MWAGLRNHLRCRPLCPRGRPHEEIALSPCPSRIAKRPTRRPRRFFSSLLVQLHHHGPAPTCEDDGSERSTPPLAMRIDESCNNFENCEPSCPNTAISASDNIYVVDHEKCTKCIGAFDKPQ